MITQQYLLEMVSNPSSSIRKLIGNTKIYTNEQLVYIINQYNKHPNDKSLELLIQAFGKMIAKLIFARRGTLNKIDPQLTFDDVFNEIIIHIVKEIKRYHPDKSSVSTYMHNVINNTLRTAEQHFGEKVLTKSNGVISLDKPITNHSDKSVQTLGDMIPDELDINQEYEKEKQNAKIKKYIARLPMKQRKLIEILFGFVPNDQYENEKGIVTIASIADKIGVSRQYLNKECNAALDNLRKVI